MSKYLPDWAYDLNNCTKCTSPGHQPPCDPIDININVNCCCDDNGNGAQCCCQQGVFEALSFLQNLESDDIEVYGFATGGGNVLSSGAVNELTEDYVILSDFPNRVVSLCAIWIIRAPASEVPGGISEAACQDTTTDCCCNPGLRERLLGIPPTQQVAIALNNQSQSINDTTGVIRLVCNDSVWIQDCVGSDTPPNCTGDFISIPLCNIAWFQPVPPPTPTP